MDISLFFLKSFLRIAMLQLEYKKIETINFFLIVMEFIK